MNGTSNTNFDYLHVTNGQAQNTIKIQDTRINYRKWIEVKHEFVLFCHRTSY